MISSRQLLVGLMPSSGARQKLLIGQLGLPLDQQIPARGGVVATRSIFNNIYVPVLNIRYYQRSLTHLRARRRPVYLLELTLKTL